MLPIRWHTARLALDDATHADRDLCHACLAESQDIADLDPAFSWVPPSEIEAHISRSLEGAQSPARPFQMQVLRLHATGEAAGYWHFMAVPAQPGAVGVSILLIRPAYRRLGLGRELITAALAQFPPSTQELWARVYLANPRAIAFWASLGFCRLVRHQGHHVSSPAERPSIILGCSRSEDGASWGR